MSDRRPESADDPAARQVAAELEARKDHHLDLVVERDVERRGVESLFDSVKLVHCALPELSLAELDTSVTLLGKRLRAPLMVVGMTGGTERAGRINRDIAAAAQRAGVAFGLGSQRPMLRNPERTSTYRVRDVAPDVLVFGNIGAQQAAQMSVAEVRAMLDAIGADALSIHLNPAQELVQPGGDRSFVGCLDAIRRLAGELGPRVWVKETGCGLSREVAVQLVAAGVGGLDVSGAGGTSWTRVEELRAEGTQAALGAELNGWGIPTAAAVAACADVGVPLVASGGVRSGGDVVKALALGATLGGLARPLVVAWHQGGREAVDVALDGLLLSIRSHLLLCGARDVAALRTKPRVLTGDLPRWIDALRGGA